jgi:uncharacterized membrane protein
LTAIILCPNTRTQPSIDALKYVLFTCALACAHFQFDHSTKQFVACVERIGASDDNGEALPTSMRKKQPSTSRSQSPPARTAMLKRTAASDVSTACMPRAHATI